MPAQTTSSWPGASVHPGRISLHARKASSRLQQGPGEELQASLAFLDGLRAKRRATMAATAAMATAQQTVTRLHTVDNYSLAATQRPETPEDQVMTRPLLGQPSAKKLAQVMLPSERMRRFTLAASGAGEKPLPGSQQHQQQQQQQQQQQLVATTANPRRQTLSLARARDRLFHITEAGAHAQAQAPASSMAPATSHSRKAIAPSACDQGGDFECFGARQLADREEEVKADQLAQVGQQPPLPLPQTTITAATTINLPSHLCGTCTCALIHRPACLYHDGCIISLFLIVFATPSGLRDCPLSAVHNRRAAAARLCLSRSHAGGEQEREGMSWCFTVHDERACSGP